MAERVAIIGVGYTPFAAETPNASFRELIFEAATAAYRDAEISPRQVDTFVSVSEDYLEGTAIVDEYVPDQLGAVLKPVHTLTTDGVTALGAMAMQLRTGEFEIGVIEGRSKASNIVYPLHIEAMALDPVSVRPLGLNPRFVAGLEMRAFLEASGNTEEQAAAVVRQNRGNALRNSIAAYGADVSIADVMSSAAVSDPLKEGDIAQYADGAIVLVLATETTARKLNANAVYVKGVSWTQDTPNLDDRDWRRAPYAEKTAQRAYRMAGISDPLSELHLAEVDDSYSYKQLQHLEAIGLADYGRAGANTLNGDYAPDGKLPVNASGGRLGCGYGHDLSSLHSILEVVLQLRGHAGPRQIDGAKLGLAQSWRGIPTSTGGVAILEAAAK